MSELLEYLIFRDWIFPLIILGLWFIGVIYLACMNRVQLLYRDYKKKKQEKIK